MNIQTLLISYLFYFILTPAKSQDSLKIQLADSLYRQAWKVYLEQPDQAQSLLLEAMALFQKEKSWEQYIQSLNGISLLEYQGFRKSGDGAAFFQNAQKAVDEAEKYLSQEHKEYANALSNLGLAYKNYKVNLELALTYYQKSIEIMQAVGEKPSVIAISYYNIGKLCRTFGDYDEGIRYLRKAKELFEQKPQKNLVKIADTYQALAHHYREKKEYVKALEHYYAYLNLRKRKPPVSKSAISNLIYCYNSLSRIYTEQTQFDSADFYLTKIFSLYDEGIKSREMQSNENLAYFHQLQSNYQEALSAYQRANELAQKRYSAPKHRIKSRTLKQVGDAYRYLKDYDNALLHYQKALVLLAFDFDELSLDKNPQPAQLITIQVGLDIAIAKAEAFRQRYDTSKDENDLLLARQNYQFAAHIIDAQRRNFLADGSKHTLAAKALTAYEGAIENALLLHQLSGTTSYLEEAFGYAERNKSMLLLESMQENMAKVAGQLSAEDLQEEKALNNEIAFLEKQLIAEKRKGEKQAPEKIKDWEKQLFDTRQQYQKLVASFEKKYPDYYQLKHQTAPISVKQIRQQLLQPDMALIEYFVGNEHLYVFGISQNHIQVEQVLRTASLSNSLEQLIDIISQPPFQQDVSKIFQQFGHSSWTLAQQLFLPIRQQLPSKVNRLIIIPDDQLAYLPFELLLTQAPASGVNSFSPQHFDYLLKQYAISYNYSATLLINHLRSKTARHLKPIVGFAPTFTNGPIASSRECQDGEVYGLQCNGEEVQAISQIFEGQVQEGAAASIEAFKTMAKDYRIIHLATHACAGESDAFNKIYFSDGFLTNFDLNQLELNAELAVLSACNTGSGQLVKGEGVMSLSRGFILANCPSTLMSLWTVDDCITSELMVRFYEKIREGFTKDEALRQTKIEHLKTADKTGLHPYYWAAFLQSGNAAPLSLSSGWNYWWSVPIILLFMLFFFWQKKV